MAFWQKKVVNRHNSWKHLSCFLQLLVLEEKGAKLQKLKIWIILVFSTWIIWDLAIFIYLLETPSFYVATDFYHPLSFLLVIKVEFLKTYQYALELIGFRAPSINHINIDILKYRLINILNNVYVYRLIQISIYRFNEQILWDGKT